MALISVDLSEITRPVNGDIRKVLDEIIGRLLDLVFCELDSYYGNNDWCAGPKVCLSGALSKNHNQYGDQ